MCCCSCVAFNSRVHLQIDINLTKKRNKRIPRNLFPELVPKNPMAKFCESITKTSHLHVYIYWQRSHEDSWVCVLIHTIYFSLRNLIYTCGSFLECLKWYIASTKGIEMRIMAHSSPISHLRVGLGIISLVWSGYY